MLEYARSVLGIMRVNCYTVYCSGTKHGIIIDPGANIKTIVQTIDELGIKPDAVVLTHSHFDHSAHADDIRKMYDIPLIIHEKEASLLKDPTMNLSASFMNRPISLVADRLVKDGDEICFGKEKLTVISTPGHTVGSMSLYSEGALFSGDTLFCRSYGRTDFMTGNEYALAASIKRLYELPNYTKVNPGHNDITTIGDEKLYNIAVKALMEKTE